MGKETAAWVLPVSAELSVVIAEYEISEYLLEYKELRVPETPNFCSCVVLWQKNFLPVVDLDLLLQQDREENKVATSLGVLAYQKKRNQPLQYIGCKLASAPKRILVHDDDVANCPSDCPKTLRELALLFINYRDKQLAVLNIKKLCSESFALYMNDNVSKKHYPLPSP